ncbi:hypothetical protein M0638_02990 [Roseomonas sp. NAR14]|uniref:Uncharacterized protein n=1 Tax=Roseomonas acroporae TaxID=2937791 RepID=A0A9X1Y4N7_9PROT|nr:hypothetical protein [Roseomonas acroporae]MCK8783348.1 hypothetical protein [Roseomonas acroporae]
MNDLPRQVALRRLETVEMNARTRTQEPVQSMLALRVVDYLRAILTGELHTPEDEVEMLVGRLARGWLD